MAKVIHWAGDSTVKNNDFTTYPQTGIGQVMGMYLNKEVQVVNHAENGRSTKSFIDEMRLATIYKAIQPGDLLFIQFGHNDAKVEDPKRYTDPFGDYQLNLEKFVHVARNRQALPVFITPVCRRWFEEDGSLSPEIHGDYPEAMIEVATQLKVPVIDLYTLSSEMIEGWGDEGSKSYFVTTDNTHLIYPGAVAFAGLIAKGLKQLGGVYKELLCNPELL